MEKFFGKTLTTDKEIAMKKLLDKKYALLKETQAKRHEAFRNYYALEGKYAKGVETDEWAGQGMRGYNYVYETEAAKRAEENEMELYYNTNIQPLKDLEHQLVDDIGSLKEQLCILLYGYGLDKYYKMEQIADLEKNIEKLKKEIIEKNNFLTKLKNEFASL